MGSFCSLDASGRSGASGYEWQLWGERAHLPLVADSRYPPGAANRQSDRRADADDADFACEPATRD
jgi:hypothetical protein